MTGCTPNLPTTCACGKLFTVLHAVSCSHRGYLSLRHNELRGVTATILQEVAHNVTIEPSLQPLSGESFHLRSVNQHNQAQLDMAASGI